MRTYLVDTSLWIEFFAGSPKGTRARAYLFKADALVTHSLVIGELQKVYDGQGRSGEEFERDLMRVRSMSTILEDLPVDIATEAGRTRADPPHPNMGLIDCLLLAIARSRRACKVLTCDSQFRGLKEALVVGGP